MIGRRIIYVKIAVILLINICVILAVLLLTQAITPLISGIVFAVVLVTLGGLSKGFRRRSRL
jgi:hypothetical protein